ncbi:hypothetical protein O0I10_007251 [Lichtheimia ornata]|uniref:Glutamine amidotransferase domain-containing protein n=1 Tax=Lichtheimia ornata TaxID=688661 RepID=A0AAD7XY55_9FUNG|nr:uncharacterized protein O0I10_007251 [Lichtheimia ornata]KAJ8657171.1 hypothetical protein O0I10_007251 [Lichtheimia ornata]
MPRQLNLALLVCDTPRKEVVEKYGDYPHLFPQVFNGAIGDRDVQISWKHFDVVHKQEYPDLQDLADNKTFDGIVITGSVASAYLDDPWILKLVDFVKVMRTEPYRSQVRLVGVCFGHQIIARACGGTCVKNPKGWEFGVFDINLTPWGKQFLKTDKSSLRIHQVHQDHVEELPPNFHNLATTAPHTPFHGFVSDDYQCITIQGHPEYVRGFVKTVLTIRRDAGIVPKDYANEQLERLDSVPDNTKDNLWLVGRMIDFILGNLRC